MNDHPQFVTRETYAPDAPLAVASRLDAYKESWDMLEASDANLPRFTLAGCLPPSGEAQLDMYKDSLAMLDEYHSTNKQQNVEAMGFFVHGMLLSELAKLERQRESLGLLQVA